MSNPSSSVTPEKPAGRIPTGDSGRLGTLLLGTAVLLAAIGLAGGGFAMRDGVMGIFGRASGLIEPLGLFGLKVLTLQCLLVAMSTFAVLGATRLRARRESLGLAAARRESGEGEDDPSGRGVHWGDEPIEDEKTRQVTYQVGLHDVEHHRKLYYLFLAVLPLAIIVSLGIYGLWVGGPTVAVGDGVEVAAASDGTGQAVALSVIYLAISCVWLVLARTFGAVDENDLPEGCFLALACREGQWTTLAMAATTLVSLFWASAEGYVAWLVLLWVVMVATEQLIRVVLTWLKAPREDGLFVEPVNVLLRELTLSGGNPVSSLFRSIETRFGVSFRSSWAIRFVRAAILPTVLLAGLMYWGMSCLSMVGPGELGVRERFGRRVGEPLSPGLHLKLPWPWGRVIRYNVKRVHAMPIGFTTETSQALEAGGTGEFKLPRAFLWGKEHGREEFALMLGGGQELVVVDAVVYYKVREDTPGFEQYIYTFQNPTSALEGFAYRALMEQTRSATLEDILATNRSEFARQLKKGLRDAVEEHKLGIEVVDVALMNLHPPIEVADAYLDVISAEIEASRYQIEAEGAFEVGTQDAQREAGLLVSEAQVEKQRQLSQASEEASKVTIVRDAYLAAPKAFELRQRGEVLREILSERPWTLIHADLDNAILDLRDKPSGDELPVREK